MLLVVITLLMYLPITLADFNHLYLSINSKLNNRYDRHFLLFTYRYKKLLHIQSYGIFSIDNHNQNLKSHIPLNKYQK